MAARINKRHQQMVREKIRASQLINRIENHVLGQKDAEGQISYPEMSQTQMTGALGLLKKVVPDLKSVDADIAATGELRLKLVSFLDVSPEQLET